MKKAIIFIIFNFILFSTLFLIYIFTLYTKYEGNGKLTNDYTKFYSYRNVEIMNNEQEEILLDILNDKNIFDSEYIFWDKEIITKIEVVNTHKRAYGRFYIYGTYSSEENLKKFLKTFEIEKFENDESYLVYEPEINTYVSIYKISENDIKLSFYLALPYKYNPDKLNEENETIKYFMKINENTRAEIRNDFFIVKIKFILLDLLINIVIISIYKIYKKE